MNQDPFKEYLRQTEPGKREKGYVWQTAIGLQAVDGLKASDYLIDTAIQNIEGRISIDEAWKLLENYYLENLQKETEERTEEADKVSVRIAKILSEKAFSFTPNEKNELHNRDMHISGMFKDGEKATIEDILSMTNESGLFTSKNVNHIRKIYNHFKINAFLAGRIYKQSQGLGVQDPMS